ncbi:MAG: hypothetical protein RLZZ626_541, partial [Actinomycetota bacterium]
VVLYLALVASAILAAQGTPVLWLVGFAVVAIHALRLIRFSRK